jgi:hypothetical protein
MVRGGSKLEKELKQDGDTILMPVESLPKPIESLPVINETVAKKAVKRVMSDKQVENAKKLGELSKARWEALRVEKARLKAEEEEKKKADEKALIDAGTHIRMKVTKGKPRGRAVKKKLKLIRQPAYEEKNDSSDDSDNDTTETETDTDVEDVKPRYVRKQVKKNLRVLERVDEAISRAPMNPYVAMLQGRWN